MFNEGFAAPITPQLAEELRARARRGRGAVLTATTLAASGHPGGSFSSMELYAVLYACARIRPSEPRWPARDRIVVSHGHTSPGVYSALALDGFFPLEEFEAHFRQTGSVFEGHVERSVPGVEWTTGNLGQGLSAGVGMALAARATGSGYHTYVVMSDGEQHKGQVAEARRMAVKEGLTDLTVLVDMNNIQISGRTSDIMPVHIAEDFAADGWRVIEIDGHHVEAVYGAVRDALADDRRPVAIVAHTVIGKGVSFMEGDPQFHGRGLTADEYDIAMAELGLEPDLEQARARRELPCGVEELPLDAPLPAVSTGEPRTYGPEQKSDNRSAWGNALVDLAEANSAVPIRVLDCDLAGSVKTDGFARHWPGSFVQCGVGEHNAATVGGALSVSGVLAFWADFGVFGIDEVYNQQRLNDINGAALKLVVTHCGLDVGEDGKTHQCLDYVGALRDFFGWKVIVPADPNQTDRATRAMAVTEGNVALAMGRSKLAVVLGENGKPLFAGGYEFRYGEIVWAREGTDACVLAMGTIVGAAVEAADAVRSEGIDVAVGVVACPLDLDDRAMTTAASTGAIVTVEDHNVRTGLGESVAAWLSENRGSASLTQLGVEGYQPSGRAEELLAGAGLSAKGIAQSLREVVGG